MSRMAQKLNDAASTGVTIKPRKEESASRMVPRLNDAATRGVPTELLREAYVGRTAQMRCSFEGCTNLVQRGGVCITHGAKLK